MLRVKQLLYLLANLLVAICPQIALCRMVDKNVVGTALDLCCDNPLTGFYRNGYCETGPQDHGRHVVCAVVTEEFLEYTKSQGNDLSTPRPGYNFPGLNDGDCWCLCALRWQQAFLAGKAPRVKLAASHENALNYVSLGNLRQHAIDPTTGSCTNRTEL